jgi:uncharacterized protein (TIGR03435 family)
MRNNVITWLFLVALVMVSIPWAPRAQTPQFAPAKPAFEVASVKKVVNNEGFLTLSFDPERFEALATLHTIIQMAYDLRDYQLEKEPSWLYSDFFQIIAKSPGSVPVSEMRLMLRSLLADRFKVVAHLETRVVNSYALVMTRADGRMGPQLQKTAVDCAALGPNAPSAPSSSKAWCGLRGTGPRRVTGQGATMGQFAGLISGFAGRTVVDETGLDGGYDFEFLWFPEQTTADSGPSLATALEDQLGLKLRPAKGPLDFFVIDHVEPPTPD